MSEHYHFSTLSEKPLSIEKAVSSLAATVNRYRDEHPLPGHRDRAMLVTFRQPLLPTELSEWLCRQTLYPKLFWMNRERDFSVAGIGIADTITSEGAGSNEASFEKFAHCVAGKDPDARYFGGFRFNNQEEQEPIWNEFSSFSFILPLVQLTLEKGAFAISCNLWLECGDELQQKISAITDMLKHVITDTDCSAIKMPELLTLTYNPDEKNWIEQCQKALLTFEAGEMEKIMLARQTTLEFSRSFSPLLFLLHYPYPQNAIYRFYFEPAENHAFFSFTPERLYRRDGNMLLTEALAGTCSKESTNGSDHHASEALLNSEKDIREHNFVREMITHELGKICTDIDMEKEVKVLQLNRLAHLYTRCTAQLKAEFQSDSAVLQLLHPTPAVGGVPTAQAMQKIMELEPFSRGWYAAPVGWVSRDAAEFSVAIRSALVYGRFACLYSGAGLVKGSDPFSEWEEVDQKIGDILSITRQEA
jgi:menaquinone-specific isochorismate synthase